MKKRLIVLGLLVVTAVAIYAIRGEINYQEVRKDTNLQNVVETFSAIPAAGNVIVVIAPPTQNIRALNNPSYITDGGANVAFTQPPVPMTIQITVTSNPAGYIYLAGVDARNNLIVERKYFSATARSVTKETVQAFARIDSMSFSPSFSASAGVTGSVQLSTGRSVGLSNPINGYDNVYKMAYQIAQQTPVDVSVTSLNVCVSGNFFEFNSSAAQPLATFVPPQTGTSTSVTVWYRQSDVPLQ